jgi:hypothetical protein
MKILFLFISVFLSSSFAIAQNVYDVTPRTKNGDNEVDTTLTKEELFIKENFPTILTADWVKGMRFMFEIEPNKYSVFPLGLYNPNNDEAISSKKLSPFDYEGKIFTIVNVESRAIDCPIGECISTCIIFDCEGVRFEFCYSGSQDEMRRDNDAVLLNGLTYLDEVDKAKRLLLNKELYILTPHWRTVNEEGKVQGIEKQKFEKITITNVGVGSLRNPVRLVFEDENEETYFIDIRFSNTNLREITSKVLIKHTRNSFVDKLAFDDPYQKYQNISPEIWSVIQQEKVQVGMTKQECELSWGKPESINETTTDFAVSEQWVFDTGSFLYFDNGILTTIHY